MTRESTDLLQETLDLLVLRTLLPAPLHGWAISKQIRRHSDGVLEVNQGSLYPALHRLEDRGLIRGEWGISPEGRRAKFYPLTPRGTIGWRRSGRAGGASPRRWRWSWRPPDGGDPDVRADP